MENDAHFMRELEELAMKAQSNFHFSKPSAPEEDRDHLQKMYHDFSSSHQTLAKVMMDGIGTLEKALRSTVRGSDESIKAFNLLRHLKACYDHCSLEEAVKSVKNCHQLAETQQVISIIFISCILSLIISI